MKNCSVSDTLIKRKFKKEFKRQAEFCIKENFWEELVKEPKKYIYWLCYLTNNYKLKTINKLRKKYIIFFTDMWVNVLQGNY